MTTSAVLNKVHELDTKVSEEIGVLIQDPELGPDLQGDEKGFWYVQMPSAGVRVYSFEDPRVAIAHLIR